MTYEEVLQGIEAKYKIRRIASGYNSIIQDIRLISSETKIWAADVLYFGDFHLIEEAASWPKQMLLMEETCSKELLEASESLNIAVFPAEQFNVLFNEVNDLFLSELKNFNNFNQLIGLSLKGKSKEQIIDAAASMIGNPLIVVDTTYKVLAYSSTCPVKDKLWQENIERGHCTYDFLALATELAPKQVSPENSEAYSIYCPISPASKYGSKIYWNNAVIGYIFLFEEYTPMTSQQKDFLPLISYLMSDLLSKSQDFASLHSPLSEKILNNLLIGDKDTYVDTLLNYTKIHFPEKMYCLVLKLRDNNYQAPLTDLLKEQLKYFIPKACITVYQGNMVCVICSEEAGKLSNETVQEIRSKMGEHVQYMTISRCFSKVMEVKSHYLQCLTLQKAAIRLNKTKQLLWLEEYVFYTLLAEIPDETKLKEKVHPALPILRQYDFQNRGTLYETLDIYIKTQGNLKETAARLFVHRNSLSYRMNKIMELTQIDLTDTATIYSLHMSFCIEQYLQCQ